MSDVQDKKPDAIDEIADIFSKHNATLEEVINQLVFLLADATAQLSDYKPDEDAKKQVVDHLAECIKSLCTNPPIESSTINIH